MSIYKKLGGSGESPDSKAQIYDHTSHSADTSINPEQINKPDGKLQSMFWRFASGARLHRFDAERLGDHCLPTTIAGLQTQHSIQFSRERVLIPNRFGSETSVMKYWLENEHLLKARKITGLEEVAA